MSKVQAASTEGKEWCWPWSHDWAKWTDNAAYEKSSTITGSVYEIGLVQERRCKLCNAAQRRMVKDSG